MSERVRVLLVIVFAVLVGLSVGLYLVWLCQCAVLMN